jgi:hypothetical protein
LIINLFGKLPNNSLVRMADSHRTVPALHVKIIITAYNS